MPVDHTKNIIEVNNVSFSYDNENVLKNINFQVHKGDYLGIVGPNGAGKTTLIKVMLGLLKPNYGSVKILTNKIGYVPQKAISFDENFPATAKEVVAMGNFKNKKSVEGAIEKVGMLEFKNKLIGELSGGQQQRIFIARALAADPDIIFLDEPTTGIDHKSQEEFYNLLRILNEQMGLTLVLVSHDIEKVLKEVMHVACIDHTLVCHSSPKDYLQSISSSELGQDIKILPHHHNK
jgi:zinc transport system ATP-binding protein